MHQQGVTAHHQSVAATDSGAYKASSSRFIILDSIQDPGS